jgi:sodium-coupled monocarboxylate transporter 8/12
MLSRRVSATGAVIGWFAGVLALIPVAFSTRISFLWYAMIGCLATMTVGWMASFIWSQPQTPELDKLVFRRSPGGLTHLK